MKLNYPFLLVLLICMANVSNAQYWFVKNKKDTTFTTSIVIEVDFRSGLLELMTYKNIDGTETTVKGKKNLDNITSINNGLLVNKRPAVYEKIPENPNKPGGDMVMGKRLYDGKIDILIFSSIREVGEANDGSRSTMGKSLFYARWEDGSYHSLKAKKGIYGTVDHMNECKAFKEKFDFDTYRFAHAKESAEEIWMGIFAQYDALCK